MRVAAGLEATDATQDTALNARGLGIAAAIMSECNIAIGNGSDPTLLQETLTETFFHVHKKELILARRHNIEIVSATADDVLLEGEECVVESEPGFLYRLWLQDGCQRGWCARKITVVYKAGFTTVPGDLRMAAIDFFAAVTQASGRDPFVKSESREIPGIETIRKDYWVGSVPGSATEDAVPDIVSGQ